MAEEAISVRCTKLKRILNENGQTEDRNLKFSHDALLDGFIALFDECSSEHLQKDEHVAEFVKKYKDDVARLKTSRPSISDFKIISLIGRGHFGQVHVVKEVQTNNVYALKTLKKSEVISQKCVACFEVEKEIMAFNESPWITRLQYAFQDVQNLYLVMEFHPGGDLFTLLTKQEEEILDEKIAKFYLAEIVLALHSLHELGYVHRDVKPENILIDKNGHIKLADFGSAAKLSKKDEKVYSKISVGTPAYISPEVLTSVEGLRDGYGVECDWWSLGVIAYEMMYGKNPFSGNTVALTFSKIMNFKESLSFPTGFKATTAVKGLIRGLLTDIENRLGYENLVKHSFFKDVDWTSLATDQPPYIPTIAGADDTSNFDKFDPREEPPTFGSKAPMKKAFCGKNLPFVGFTFMKCDNDSIPHQGSERQRMLEKERANRSQLQQELNKAKEELEETKKQVTYWKDFCHILKNSQSSTFRPKDIPHRFTTVLNMRATRCPICLGNILFGRKVSKCTECNMVCHCKCSIPSPRTCGLLTQHVEHFSEGLGAIRTETSLLVSPENANLSDGNEVSMEGCLKVSRNGSAKNGWDTKYVSLKDGKLVVSESAEKNNNSVPQNQQCEQFNLCENEVKIYSAVAGSDLLGVAATDLPYVFSIEVLSQTIFWHGGTLFLLASSFPEKQRWVKALENTVNKKKLPALPNNDQKITGNLLLGMKGDERLDINTACVLNDEFVLLGAEEGLFILPVGKPDDDNKTRKIPGVRNVYQIKIEKHLRLVLLISGVDQELLSIDLRQLETCTKQSREVPLASFECQNVGNITNCHLFASKKVEDGMFLCAALPNKILVLKFNILMKCFVTRKEIDSSEPCSSILFLNTKVIAGWNKFYQIDLQKFTIKDYFDCKDTTLASSPVAILPLEMYEEFLLCYNGFGVFVDANGRRTRKYDFKWTGLPLSFAYQEPYLYVTHIKFIEICQIPPIEKQGNISRTIIEKRNARIVGEATQGGGVYVITNLKDEIHLVCCNMADKKRQGSEDLRERKDPKRFCRCY